ncbi:DUF4011 domain-containing protein [Gemella cuniculi]|uniref:DUF4011 domain-containing protein n=1 Tax=Gemella cuniculi TaxID=150240 RepID=UPI000407ADE9|nr:DUF4011 domain-containing protein [Gemella cuniculi]
MKENNNLVYPELKKKFVIENESIGVVSYSFIKSNFPLIRSIRLINNSKEKIENLKLDISFDFEYISNYTKIIDSLDSGEILEVEPELEISYRELFDLTETITDRMIIEVKSENEELNVREISDLPILPTNYWVGRIYPESIASFVLPNIPKVVELLPRVSQILKENTGNNSITGYQTGDKNRVREQMAAIYSAIYEQNIFYAEIPAGFDTIGQRVRTPEEVLSAKMGNCIEMSTLYASVAEACGLNPIILVVDGHAFVGVWLEENTFDINRIEQKSEIEKRIATGINDIEILESTYLNSNSDKTFEQAVRKGLGNLEDLKFSYAIDIKRTHFFGIRPMPIKVFDNGEIKLKDYGLAEDSEEKGVLLKTIEEYYLDTTAKKDVDKKEIWMKNMLDLTKRNSLISFRPSLKSIQIFNSDISKLEDALADGEIFDIKEVVNDWMLKKQKNDIIDIESYKEFIDKISQNEFKSKRIRTFLEKDELEKTLKFIYRETQRSIEETGASSLFLAMGFLKWIDDKDSRDNNGDVVTRLAPLVLVPVELIRKSNNNYQLSIRDEDAQMNITLLEFLRQRFNLVISGLNPLPEDDSGVNLPLIFNSIRKRIMNYKGWTVNEIAVLGNFSFSQFVMWNDLNSRFEKLTENKVVNALVNGRYRNYSEKEIEEKELDNINVSNLTIPSSIDSSQLLSIIEAAGGESFVLHGPPGTGKSQTITNMIANALAQGQSVLFVAEKMAALNVVYDRLSKIKLNDFCLELHSNKTQKRVVLEKLENNLNLQNIIETKEYDRTTNKIQSIKVGLNTIIDELHKVRKNGFSIYDMVLLYEQMSDVSAVFSFTDNQLREFDLDKWENSLEMVRYLIAAGENLGYGIGEHPLRDFKKSGYEIHKKDELINLISNLELDLSKFLKEIEQNRELYQLLGTKKEKLYNKLSMLEINYLKNLDRDILKKITDKKIQDVVKSYVSKEKEYNKNRIELLQRYVNNIENIELREIKQAFLEAKEKFLFKNRKINKALRPLNSYTRNDFIVTGEVANEEMEKINKLQEYSIECKDILEDIIGLDLKVTDSKSIYELYEIVDILNDNEDLSIDDILECIKLLKEYKLEKFKEIKINRDKVNSQIDLLTKLVGLEKKELKEDYYRNLLDMCSIWKTNIDEWRNWSKFCEIVENLEKDNLENISSNLFNRLENSKLDEKYDIKLLEKEYLKSIAKSFIMYFTKEVSALSKFSGLSTNKKIEEYNRLVDKYEQLSQEQVLRKLQEQIPNSKYCSDEEAKQLANINRIIQSKGRGTSIRTLFKENGTVIKKLAPCMLMSPLSVAQYIDLDFPKFDLVIFDEASQIKTSIAVGAMSRAENCVIVGDPKQMPPTSFFSTNKEDEDNLHVEDLESLLEDCLAVNMPQKYLKCHYRSQSESLIAFSNQMYYKNKMITFPSPNDTKSKVKFNYVNDGIYDRGKTRTNLKEAEEIVNEIVRRLTSEDENKNSIGVVTFNLPQQILIDDLLQERFSKNLELEKIANKMHEPIFIKNLENVQGDERDVILFSVTYGKDENEKFYQNFGPLAKKGGWRRLNVAVSRARKEMVLFSSIMYDDIKITARTQEGVIGLRKFIEFANKGMISLPNVKESMVNKGDALERQLAEFLNKNGYATKLNLGASDFNIPLAVVDLKNNDKYLCAILLDNNHLKKLSTTRDKYRLIPNVLQRMGWNVYRIWGLDWYENKKQEQQKLLKYLNSL